jgi:hypothetical protein
VNRLSPGEWIPHKIWRKGDQPIELTDYPVRITPMEVQWGQTKGMTEMTKNEVHPFERAGLGKAPFRYVGQVAQDIEYGQRRLNSRDEAISITTTPGGTCDACGTYIVDMFRVRSADGRESVVGCDCILKVAETIERKKTLQDDVKAMKKAKAKVAAEKKKVKDRVRVQAAITTMDTDTMVQSALGSQPHPYQSMASQGKTMADYVAWMFLNAGLTGQVQAAKIVEGALKG